MATPTPSFKRPADPLQPAGSAKRPATGPARTGTGAADSSPPSEETKDIAALKKQYQSREANLLIRLSRKEAEVQSLLVGSWTRDAALFSRLLTRYSTLVAV